MSVFIKFEVHPSTALEDFPFLHGGEGKSLSTLGEWTSNPNASDVPRAGDLRAGTVSGFQMTCLHSRVSLPNHPHILIPSLPPPIIVVIL